MLPRRFAPVNCRLWALLGVHSSTRSVWRNFSGRSAALVMIGSCPPVNHSHSEFCIPHWGPIHHRTAGISMGSLWPACGPGSPGADRQPLAEGDRFLVIFATVLTAGGNTTDSSRTRIEEDPCNASALSDSA